MTRPRLLILAVAVLMLSRSAAAAPITWFITGPVISSSGALTGIIPVGTPASLTVNYESTEARPPLFPGFGYIYTTFGLSATLSVGDFTVPSNSSSSFAIVSSGGGVEFFILGPTLPPGIPPFTFNEIRLLTGTVDPNAPTFGEAVGTPQTAFAIVQGTPPFGSEGVIRFSGPVVVQQPAAVPEPATMTLLATGLVVAWRARRKSR
jgi:hypothetical protein